MAQKPYSLNKNKYLLQPELEKLEYLLDSYLNKDRRNCSLLYLALKTGARATELLSITHKDLNHYEQSVYIKGLKGSNDREIPIPGWLFKDISLVAAQTSEQHGNAHLKPDDKLLYPISYNRLRQIWQLYRPVQKKFHCLRHSFAIELYKKTKDIRLLQVALGHRNITNTMVYADYIYSQNELKRLIL